MFIHELAKWPHFEWNAEELLPLLSDVRYQQGVVVGEMGALGFDAERNAHLEILTQEVQKSSEIEGEFLPIEQVRSSVARRLGLDISGLVRSDSTVDGAVEMMADATSNCFSPLTAQRLHSWHSALFPGGHLCLRPIKVGGWRTPAADPMQVVSGAMRKEKVHFQAPPASRVEEDMHHFLACINEEQEIDLVVKSAIAHLWFLTIHPFEDGNGRIARAIADMILAQSDQQQARFYSMSAQIRNERNAYYEILERTQKSTLDITAWLTWYLNCLKRALRQSDSILQAVVHKHRFWAENADKILNDRQKKVLNRLLEGFEGKLTTSKWAKITKCSQDTALRDIQHLLEIGILQKLPGGGRSTAYAIRRRQEAGSRKQ